MSKFFKRYRRNTTVKALKDPEPIYQLTQGDFMPNLQFGR